MEKVASYIGGAVIAPFYWTHSARKAHATRTINEYLQNMTETSLLSGFGKSLESLLPSQDSEHVEQIFNKSMAKDGVWNEESLSHFIEVATGGALEDLTSSLWQYFARAAYFR